MYQNENAGLDTAEPLLLLPGLMSDARIFAAQLAHFPSARAATDYSRIDSLAGMAACVLEAAPPAFALLGHSMGGRVALEVLRQAPERVTRLALVSTGVHPLAPGESEKRHALRDLGRGQGMAALVDAWLPPMLASDGAHRPELLQALRAMCLDAGLDRYEAQIAALLSRPAVEDVLGSIACPTLVAVGSEDRWSPPDQHCEIAAALPDAKLVIVPGAGHMLPAEAPEALNTAIARWLGQST